MPQEKIPVYVEKIQRDPTVCNNCFRRCREVFKPTHWLRPTRIEVDGEDVDTVMPEPIRESVPGVTHQYPIMSQTSSAQNQRVCKCGVFDLSATLRSAGDALTKRESLQLAERLADRLEEVLPSFRRDVFRIAVYQYKSDEKLSNKDDEVFKRATEDSI